MGRRSFWYKIYQSSNIECYNEEIARKELRKLVYILLEHNLSPIDDRGENIDSILTFKHKYDDSSVIYWLYFSSGGGDWATEEFFEKKHPEFYDNILRLDQFEKYNIENIKWKDWDFKDISFNK